MVSGLFNKKREPDTWLPLGVGMIDVTHPAASCRASIRVPQGSRASRPGAVLHARFRSPSRNRSPASPTGDLPPTPMAARPVHSYELPRVAAWRRTMRHHIPDCPAWTQPRGPNTAEEASHGPVCGELNLSGGPSIARWGLSPGGGSVAAAAGIQFPTLKYPGRSAVR